MFRKLVSLLLVIMMASLLAAPGLADGNFNETGLPIVNEPITLKIAATRHPNDATASFNEKHAIIQAAKETNINIEWIEITNGDTDSVAVLLAGDMPDVFLGNLLSDSIIQENSNMFLVLNDLLETYCPNVYALYEADFDGWRNFLTYPDGNIYGLAGQFLESKTGSMRGVQWINKEWLDKLNLDVPTTLDELYNVLVAFRDNDVNGNGDPSDEIPMNFSQSHNESDLWNFITSWGIPGYYDIVDGKVIPTMNTEGFRSFLEFCHKLVDEKLLNVEGLTSTQEQYTAELDSMRTGTFFGWGPFSFITDGANQKEYVEMAPVSANGVKPRIMPLSNTAYRNCFVVNANSPYTKEALRLWDYLSQNQHFARYVCRGEDGLIYKLAEDGVYYSNTPTAEDLIAMGYEKYVSSIGTSTLNASLGLTLCSPLQLYMYTSEDPTTTTGVRRLGVKACEPYFMEQVMPKGIVPTDVQEEYDFVTEGLLEMIDQFIASSVLNGVTDEKWNNYIGQLSNLGYDYYIDWNQRYFDGDFIKK